MGSIEKSPALASIPSVQKQKRSWRVWKTGWFAGREGFWFLIALGVVWWVLTTCLLPEKQRYLFPSPLVTLRAFKKSLPELAKGTWSSFLILAPGYLLAVIIGVGWGVLVGNSRVLRRLFTPFSRIVSPVPPTIYIPYAIALIPTFRLSAIFVVFIGAFWPVFLNSAMGASVVPERYRDNARVLGFGRFEYLWRVVFPSALPHIFSGMTVGLAMSFILLTVAELFGATAGLGRFVQYYADFAEYPRMVAGILYTGAITFGSMTLLDWIRRRAIFWPN
jgi:NitT/TauT family transport system permease protein